MRKREAVSSQISQCRETGCSLYLTCGLLPPALCEVASHQTLPLYAHKIPNHHETSHLCVSLSGVPTHSPVLASETVSHPLANFQPLVLMMYAISSLCQFIREKRERKEGKERTKNREIVCLSPK